MWSTRYYSERTLFTGATSSLEQGVMNEYCCYHDQWDRRYAGALFSMFLQGFVWRLFALVEIHKIRHDWGVVKFLTRG